MRHILTYMTLVMRMRITAIIRSFRQVEYFHQPITLLEIKHCNWSHKNCYDYLLPSKYEDERRVKNEALVNEASHGSPLE